MLHRLNIREIKENKLNMRVYFNLLENMFIVSL